MDGFLNFYQHIPGRLNPVAVNIGVFSIGWYSLMYLAGFLTVYLLLRYRVKKGELNLKIPKETLENFLFSAFVGLLIGARLGYVFFYDFSYFWHNPLAVISPYDPVSHEFIGIYGMSYHGGAIGVFLAAWIFLKKSKINFWQWSDFVVPAVPAGYFFGRIGNFMNGELYGRITSKPWGMYFSETYLRHPSQLYEAILEGLALFLILWPVRNKDILKRKMLAVYLIGYATARIIAEFFREPDEQIGFLFGSFTLGQFLSALMLLVGLAIILVQKNKPPHQDKAIDGT